MSNAEFIFSESGASQTDLRTTKSYEKVSDHLNPTKIDLEFKVLKAWVARGSSGNYKINQSINVSKR